jgi:hypothetical protein
MQTVTPFIIAKVFQTTEEDIVNELYNQHQQLLLEMVKKTVDNATQSNPNIDEKDLLLLISDNINVFNTSFIEEGMKKLSDAERNELYIVLNEQKELNDAEKELSEEILRLYEMGNVENNPTTNTMNYSINLGGVISNQQNPSPVITNPVPQQTDTSIQ